MQSFDSLVRPAGEMALKKHQIYSWKLLGTMPLPLVWDRAVGLAVGFAVAGWGACLSRR